LIAACDISIAADSVSFAFTEVRIGVVPAVISATVLRKTSVGQIHELMLTGESFSAQRAVALGLINRAIPESELDGETDRYAAMLSRGAPNALAATKLLSRSERHSTLAQEHEELLTLSARHFGSEEGREGIRSFREKRQPSWVPRG
jgi:methylglutaconyl-CoA hydratase